MPNKTRLLKFRNLEMVRNDQDHHKVAFAGNDETITEFKVVEGDGETYAGNEKKLGDFIRFAIMDFMNCNPNPWEGQRYSHVYSNETYLPGTYTVSLTVISLTHGN